MSGGPESKKQLGKILLQQKLVSQEELQDILEEQKREPGARLASTAARKGRVTMSEALQALSEQHGVEAVDLSVLIVPLGLLRLIPIEMARERAVFPLRIDDDQLLLAMSSPKDQDAIDELEFVAGKKIVPAVALDHVVRGAIEFGYAAVERGEEYYVGANVTTEQLAAYGLPDLPRAPAPLDDVPRTLPPEAGGLTGSIDVAFERRQQTSQPLNLSMPSAATRVMIAIGDGEVRGPLRNALAEVGVTPVEAVDGIKALEALREPAHAIVLDVDLPAIPGLELVRRLRADPKFAVVPMIVISDPGGAWRMAQDLRETFGVQHVFVPPIDVALVTQTIRLALDGQPVREEPPPMSPPADARWNAGMAAYERGDLEVAITELEAGVRIEPNAFELQYHLGLLYGRRGASFAAVRALEHALALQPRHFAAIKNLAVIYQRSGMKHKAIDAWQRALVYAPDDETRTNIRQHMISLL